MLSRASRIASHKASLGLSDHVAGLERLLHLLVVLRTGERHRGVGGEHRAHCDGFVVEGAALLRVQVECPQGVSLGEQPK